MNHPIDDYLREHHRNYLEERKAVEAESLELGKHYDTWLITLSGGALMLSITCIEKVFHNPPLWSLVVLGVAWLALVIALGCQLWAISKSQTGLNQKILSLDYEFKATVARLQQAACLSQQPSETQEQHVKVARNLNSVAFWSFVVGMILLSIFSAWNLWHLDGQDKTCHKNSKGNLFMTEKRQINESRGTFVGSPNAQPAPLPTAVAQQLQGTTPTAQGAASTPTHSTPSTPSMGESNSGGNNAG